MSPNQPPYETIHNMSGYNPILLFINFHVLNMRVEGQVLLTLDPPGHAHNRTNFSAGG